MLILIILSQCDANERQLQHLLIRNELLCHKPRVKRRGKWAGKSNLNFWWSFLLREDFHECLTICQSFKLVTTPGELKARITFAKRALGDTHSLNKGDKFSFRPTVTRAGTSLFCTPETLWIWLTIFGWYSRRRRNRNRPTSLSYLQACSLFSSTWYATEQLFRQKQESERNF